MIRTETRAATLGLATIGATQDRMGDIVHQQKYYPAFCAFCSFNAPDAGTQIANQVSSTLPHNVPDAT